LSHKNNFCDLMEMRPNGTAHALSHVLTETDERARSDILGLTDEDLDVGVGRLEGGIRAGDELPGC
jgi:hypothetical protein